MALRPRLSTGLPLTDKIAPLMGHLCYSSTARVGSEVNLRRMLREFRAPLRRALARDCAAARRGVPVEADRRRRGSIVMPKAFGPTGDRARRHSTLHEVTGAEKSAPPPLCLLAATLPA